MKSSRSSSEPRSRRIPRSRDLALTLGDPCGIGPEITAAALLDLPLSQRRRLIICGPVAALREGFAKCGKPVPALQVFDLAHPDGDESGIRVVDTGPAGPFPPGIVCEEGGQAALAAINTAHTLCSSGRCAGMVTAPIGKKAIRLAGSSHAGHTDLLGALTGVGEQSTRMAMVFRDFRVVMTTLHVAWKKVPELLTREAIELTLRLAQKAWATPQNPHPKIAVGGLNPHAGEDGLFGNEERIAISPAIAAFRSINLNVAGPFPCDSMFKPDMRRTFDIFVAHSHDQGLIAIKALGDIRCVNVTLGLPYVRTSVGHGTAYDLAGRSRLCNDSTQRPDHRGMLAAIAEGFRLIKAV